MNNERNSVKLRTWIEIDTKAMDRNYRAFRREIGEKTSLMAVVKSNAYGNELLGFSKTIDALGADAFGVDSITEGLALREAGITKPILVLGYTIPDNFRLAAEKDIAITLSSFDSLPALQELSMPPEIHIKIDSGMHRQGFFPHDIPRLASELKKNPSVRIAGAYTHFANAKDAKKVKDTKKQAEAFLSAAELLSREGFSFMKHACASGGTLLFPEYHFDMVRVGIGLHGLWPAEETKKHKERKVKLSPILSWKTIVSEIKTMPKGAGIGYDFTETLKKDTKAAICPIGYWHGFPRALSKTGFVLIRGKRARVLGRVSMDMIVADVSGIPNIKPGDEVVLIGKQGKDGISAEEMAKATGTSNYEVVTRINPKIRRVFI